MEFDFQDLFDTTTSKVNDANMSVPRARLLDLMKAQCQVFATTYNPEGVRLGNKVLRQRLRGPALAAYYPRKLVSNKDLRRVFASNDLDTWSEAEQDRLDYIEELKQRGKGNPKKKRTAPAPTKLAPAGKKK